MLKFGSEYGIGLVGKRRESESEEEEEEEMRRTIGMSFVAKGPTSGYSRRQLSLTGVDLLYETVAQLLLLRSNHN